MSAPLSMEAEYNNRAKVPEHPAILESWRRDAAAFRAAQAEAELDLAYGASDRQFLDLFWPGPARTAPIAMFIHGGYWQSLDRSWFSHMAAGLVARGVAVAVPSYGLCPQVHLAEIVEHARAAAAFLHLRHGRPLLATGHSAGGHLAAMLLATDWEARGLPPGLVPAALPISGLFDLAPLIETSVNGALALDAAEARRLSPVLAPAPGGKLHAVVGGEEGEEYTRQSRAIAEAWDGSWESVPGANHFTVIDPLADPDSPIVAKALSLIG
jgi:arylformamidase